MRERGERMKYVDRRDVVEGENGWRGAGCVCVWGRRGWGDVL